MNARKCLSHLAIITLSLAIALITGCGPDFDDFTEWEDTDPDNNQEPNNQVPNANTNNGDEEPRELGELCDEELDCLPGLDCVGGICLSECNRDRDCPDDTHCHQVGTDSMCVPRCTDRMDCSHLEDGDDLSCVFLVQTERLGASPHQLERACLPDSSDDGVFDGIDNCPDEIHPTQSDRVADGVGDACAAEPYCHGDATDGELDFPSLSLRDGDWAIPAAIDGRWLPVLGTTDDEGEPDSPLWWLDRHSGEWLSGGDLPYAGADRTLFPDNRGGFVATPGPDAEAGAWTMITPEKNRSGPPYPSVLKDNAFPPAPPLRFSNGELHIPLATTNTVFHWRELNADLGFAVQSFATTIESRLGVTADQIESAQAIHHPDGTVSMLFWAPDQRLLSIADIIAPHTSGGSAVEYHQLQIPETWSFDDEANGEDEEENGVGSLQDDDEPNADDGGEDDSDQEDLSDFEPIAHAGPGGQLYIFDRHTGRAGRFLATRDDQDSHLRTWENDFQRLPDYDLSLFADLDDLQVYGLPRAQGLGVVGRIDDDLHIQELYFHCHPLTAAVDSSGDGVGDLIDNCPLEENPDQADLDDDAWGDLCDPDTDGDGIPDVLDQEVIESDESGDGSLDDGEGGDEDPEVIDYSRDTSNSGVDNEDDDDIDGDSILNRYDPFPFDSSNDGTPNRWTEDANNNTYSDDILRDLDLSPYRPTSTPTSSKAAWIVDGAQRQIQVGRIDQPEQARALELDSDIEPHQLQLIDASTLLFLSDAPGETNRFLVYDLDDDEVILDQSFFPEASDFPERQIRSVFMIDIDTFIVVHEGSEGQHWRISQVTPGQDLDTFDDDELFRQLPHIWKAARYDDSLFLLGAESDCRECAALYEFDLINESLSFADDATSDIGPVSLQRDHISFIELDSRGAPSRLVHLRNSSGLVQSQDWMSDAPSPLSLSATPLRNASGNTTSSPMPTLVALDRFDEGAVLWLFQPWLSTSHQWQPFVTPDDPVVEVAWQP